MQFAKQYGAFVAAAVVGLSGFALGDYAMLAWLGAAVLVALGVVLQSPRWGLLAAAVVGFGCSLYLFTRKIDPSGTSICSVSATIDCDVVNGSAASEVFGLPIALLGMGFFLGVVIAALLKPSRAARLFQTTGLLAVVGCLYALFLAFTSWQIGAVCPMCMAIYASTSLLLLASVLGLRQEDGALLDGLDQVVRSRTLLVEAATLVAVVLLGQLWYRSIDQRSSSDKVIDALAVQTPDPHEQQEQHEQAPQPARTDDIASQLAGTYVVPRGTVALEGDEPVLGDPNAPYTVVEYACFGCPHCAVASKQLHDLVLEEPSIQVRFRSFPLSNECNPGAARGGRPEVCRAAMAAQCANQEGKFWEYSGLVFANQHQLGDELLAAVASQVGLEFGKFSECMSNPAVLEQVQRDAVSGGALQLVGTPSMFLKGILGDQWVEVCQGTGGVLALVRAHEAGVSMPPAAAGMCPMD